MEEGRLGYVGEVWVCMTGCEGESRVMVCRVSVRKALRVRVCKVREALGVWVCRV